MPRLDKRFPFPTNGTKRSELVVLALSAPANPAAPAAGEAKKGHVAELVHESGFDYFHIVEWLWITFDL